MIGFDQMQFRHALPRQDLRRKPAPAGAKVGDPRRHPLWQGLREQGRA